MTITELEGRNVKLSAHTITVKDKAGKTRGLVRSASRYKDLPLREQVDFWRTLKQSGLTAHGEKVYGAVFVDNKKLYWLCDREDEDLIQLAQAVGVNVIKVAKIM